MKYNSIILRDDTYFYLTKFESNDNATIIGFNRILNSDIFSKFNDLKYNDFYIVSVELIEGNINIEILKKCEISNEESNVDLYKLDPKELNTLLEKALREFNQKENLS